MQEGFQLWGPWAGHTIRHRPLPRSIRRARSYARCWLWGAVLVATMALYWWMPK